MLIGDSAILILLLFPSYLFSMNLPTTCNLSNLPRECYCQRSRHTPVYAFNETHLRCRQLTEITTDHPWSNLPFDRLVFETYHDNLTLHRFVFANSIVRTLRFNVQNLFLHALTFENAYIGQLIIAHHDTHGGINFQSNSQIFSDTIITNLHFKVIDFQSAISEAIFSNARIYTFIIHSSKFYGFTNGNLVPTSKPITQLKYAHFLEYDYSLARNPKKISDQSTSLVPEQMTTTNVTSTNYALYITIYTIIASINTTNLTENYFPNNLDYKQVKEIELSFNQINSLDAHVFRHLRNFQGRLILIHNQIQEINPYALTDLILVKNLSLANNRIEDLSSRHFENLNHLYELDLSHNQLVQLNDNTFEYLENLHILHLNFNPLEFLHADVFANLTRLKHISFHGVQFLHLIDQEYMQWIWNLASIRVIHFIKTDFDLSDVAFCILSRYNRSLFHLSRQDSCSCNIHYFNRNENLDQATSLSVSTYDTNYLRLTPICHGNDVETKTEQNPNELILENLDEKCDYKLMYLDCDAMTTTTTRNMITLVHEKTDNLSDSEMIMHVTPEASLPSSRSISNEPSKRKPLNNVKKLFTVLGTLLAITIGAIVLVFFWYRFKAILKRRRKRKFMERQRHFNSPVTRSHRSSVPRYASVDMLGSIHSSYLYGGNKSQFEALIGPPSSTIYKNIDALGNELIENYIDEENFPQDSTGIKTISLS